LKEKPSTSAKRPLISSTGKNLAQNHRIIFCRQNNPARDAATAGAGNGGADGRKWKGKAGPPKEWSGASEPLGRRAG